MQHLLEAGAYVAVCDLKPPQSDLGKHSKFWELDITKSDAVESVVEQVLAWSKETGATLGGMVNCAGVGTAAKVHSPLCIIQSFSNVCYRLSEQTTSHIRSTSGSLRWT